MCVAINAFFGNFAVLFGKCTVPRFLVPKTTIQLKELYKSNLGTLQYFFSFFLKKFKKVGNRAHFCSVPIHSKGGLDKSSPYINQAPA